ncbi:hypothetical protein DFH08DRAFT_894837 [Mycena albidolilacea]|uniref:Uncharacterized protein n=1 Tax=Mycena albidolilacea TaxID=1033008 RepID=A0AAD6ZAX8_9AGAR|nr:hypothetical protein DFH08DRAFT_894837 [Mycena albidolilacea]
MCQVHGLYHDRIADNEHLRVPRVPRREKGYPYHPPPTSRTSTRVRIPAPALVAYTVPVPRSLSGSGFRTKPPLGMRRRCGSGTRRHLAALTRAPASGRKVSFLFARSKAQILGHRARPPAGIRIVKPRTRQEVRASTPSCTMTPDARCTFTPVPPRCSRVLPLSPHVHTSRRTTRRGAGSCKVRPDPPLHCAFPHTSRSTPLGEDG